MTQDPQILSKRGATAGAGCLTAFGVPFFVAGVFTMYAALTKHDAHPRGHDDFVAQILGGALFAFVGASIVLGGIWAMRSGRRKAARQAEHPDEPWLWNNDWASGEIRDGSNVALLSIWFFALVWNGISAGATFGVFSKQHIDGAAYLVLLFPAVGVGLLCAAIYLTIRRLKFGRSILELETLPGAIGGWFAGFIHVPATLQEADELKLTLKCVNRVTTGSGKSQSTSEFSLWEDSQTLKTRLSDDSLGGKQIPVAFRIPESCRACDGTGTRNEILWRLNAHAVMPGADYIADFVVPVFVANQPPNFTPRAEQFAAALRIPKDLQSLEASDLDLQRDAAGRIHLDIPAGRNMGGAVFMFILGAVFIVGILLMQEYAFGDSGFFNFVFVPIFCLLGLWTEYMAMSMLLRAYTLMITRDGIQLTWRMFGFSGSRSMRRDELSRITYMTNVAVNNTPYYTLTAHANGGAKMKLATWLHQDDAKRLAGEIGDVLGVEAREDFISLGNGPR
jgi:hypothetical protein